MANPWEKYKNMASDFISSSADKVGEFTSDVASDVSESVNNFASDVGEAANEQLRESIPINLRQFAYDISGGKKDVTEKDLSKGELGAAKQAVSASWKRGKGSSINYEDEVVIKNKYDFNDAKDFDMSEFIESALEKGLDPYAQVRNIAKYFSSSPEDESSMMVINIGKVEGITKESWLARGSSRTTQVLSGDTLSAIAKKNNVSLDELVRFNNIKDQDNIKVGQT